MSSSRKRQKSNRQKVIGADEIPQSSVKQSAPQINLNKTGLHITQLSANNTPSSQSASLMQQSSSLEQVPKSGLMINKKTNSKASQHKQTGQKQQALISTSNAHAINPIKNVAQTPGSAGPPNINSNSNFSCLIQKQLTSSNYGHPMETHSSQVTRSLEKIISNGSRNLGHFALTAADHHRQVQTTSQHNSVSQQSVKKGSTGLQQSQYRGAQPQQKHNIKSFKRQQLDPDLAIHEPNKVLVSQKSVTSSIVSVKSGRRPSSSFVSIGGVSKGGETQHQDKQSLETNHNLKNGLLLGATNNNRQVSQNQNAVVQKIGIFRADRLSKQIGVGSNTSQKAQQSTQLRQGSGTDSRNQKERMSSSSINSNSLVAQLPESMRDVSHEKITTSLKSHTEHSDNNSTSRAPEASYCPTILNLNQSQEIFLRQGQVKTSTSGNQQYAKHINSTNQACLLPGHMIKANGPSSMQAHSKAHQFLPPHSSQNMILSASFEKLNLFGQKQIPAMSGGNASQQNGQGVTKTLSQSSQNTLSAQHQKLLQHHNNMQNYLKSTTPGQNQHSTKPNSGGSALPQTINLKVKKSGTRIKTSKTFMTPQRLKKGKESEKQKNVTDATNASVVIVSQNGDNQVSKAQQYLRNSLMIKNQQAKLGGAQIHSSQEGVSATGESISPKQNSMKNFAVGIGMSRNTTTGGAKTMTGFMPLSSLTTANINSNSILTSANNRQGQSPISMLPATDQSLHQMGGNQKQVLPKNLNILSKSKKQVGQGHGITEQPQKMMIDKKTYQDLMNYLVKAEVKRLQQKLDKPGQLHPNITTQNQNALLMPSNSNSNLHSMNSSQQKQKSTPKPSQQNSSSKQKSGVDGFQSQQSMSRQATWQPQMTLNQTTYSNHLLKDIPIQMIGFGGESQSAETQKQTQGQSRQIQGLKHGILPQNAASNSKVAVSIFMPNNVLPLNQKAQMMKTTVSQNSQSRDASLTSHNTNGQIISTKKGVKQTVIYNYGKQALVTKQGRITSSKPQQQLIVKGSKQAQQRAGPANLLQAGSNSRNQNQVFTVSVSNTNKNQFLAMAQPSPNQTAIGNQIRGSKKGSLVVATIPTKIIKSRSLIRGTTNQAAVTGQIGMNVLKNQLADEIIPQETLKNNFMHASDQEFTQIRKNSIVNSSSPSLKELQLKAQSFPFKDRVQSAKSSTTQAQNQSQQQKPSLTPNNGAKSHRESQRYFSRPSDEQNIINQGAKVTIKQSIEKISRSKLPVTHKSSSKDNKRSKKVAESHSKESRQSATRYSNSSIRGKQKPNTAESSSDKKRSSKQITYKVDHGYDEMNKRNSLMMMLPLDVMSGPALDDFENGLMGKQTLRSGVNLMQTVVMHQKDLSKGKKRKQVSSDIGMKDAVEGIIGGNFNTFGEQSPDAFRQKRKGLDEDSDFRAKGRLIERIEHQIETELKEKQDTSLSVPVFEVTELSNNSIVTHGSNAMEILAKPPQNSLMEVHHLHMSPDLDTIQSKEVSIKIEKQIQRQNKTSHNSVEEKQKNLKNFHYSGSFGISACSPSKEDLQELEREAIDIDASDLYQAVKGDAISRNNTIEDRQSSKVLNTSATQEFQDMMISEQRHQTLQENLSSSGQKGHFQLINMSFSQENELQNTQTSNQRSQKGKIPHNTIQTYQEYEDMVEGRSPSKTHHQFNMVFNNMTKNQDASVKQVSEKIYSDADYRKQLLLQVLPQYEELDQFDQMHQDFVRSIDDSNEITEAHKRQSHLAVSKGAAQLLRLINMSLGKSQSNIFHPEMRDQESNNDDRSFDDKLETNTVVENECDSDLAYIYSGGGASVPNDIQSPSVASDRQIKSFETTSLQSPQNSTRIELQTPSNQTSQLPSHQASQNTTHITPYSVDEETRLVLLQSSEPESHRKQGGAFAVCSPRTAAQAAAIYEDGANGGRQAFVTRSVRHSNQVEDVYELGGIGNKDLILPKFGVQALGPEEEEAEEENSSFQTMREDDEETQSLGEAEQVTSFYGPEKPQYEEMVSIIQGDGYPGELMDDNIVSQIDQLIEPVPYEDQDCDTGGGSQAQSPSPHSIKQTTKKLVPSKDLKNIEQTEDLEDEDQFLFAENLNKQYQDAMEQRKYLKMVNKPRQKSC